MKKMSMNKTRKAGKYKEGNWRQRFSAANKVQAEEYFSVCGTERGDLNLSEIASCHKTDFFFFFFKAGFRLFITPSPPPPPLTIHRA